MNTKSLLYSLVLSLFGWLNLAHAGADMSTIFPPLTITTGDKEIAGSFNNSTTTKDLYSKYYGLAQMTRDGDVSAHKKIINSFLEKDLKYWKEELNRPFNAPDQPKTSNKSVQQKYQVRLARANALYASKKAAAEAYVKWLSEDIPAWLAKLQ